MASYCSACTGQPICPDGSDLAEDSCQLREQLDCSEPQPTPLVPLITVGGGAPGVLCTETGCTWRVTVLDIDDRNVTVLPVVLPEPQILPVLYGVPPPVLDSPGLVVIPQNPGSTSPKGTLRTLKKVVKRQKGKGKLKRKKTKRKNKGKPKKTRPARRKRVVRRRKPRKGQ